MDRVINVRLFSVKRKESSGLPFSDALQHIGGMALATRERQIEPDIVIRLEQLSDQSGLIFGEMVRRQSGNLPPKALQGQPLERLGVRSIGHTAAFVYDAALSAMALQLARNGVTSTRIGLYVQTLAGGSGYDILPIPNQEVWNKLRHGSVRAIDVRVSSPASLRAVDEEAKSVRRGLRTFKDTVGTAQVEVRLSMRRGDEDINRSMAIRLFNWLRGEREAGRGGISKLLANVVAEGADQAEVLNLIEGQMGAKTVLDLPDDDPQRSYQMRSDYTGRVLRENRAVLEERHD